jgi:hypothetical protein
MEERAFKSRKSGPLRLWKNAPSGFGRVGPQTVEELALRFRKSRLSIRGRVGLQAHVKAQNLSGFSPRARTLRYPILPAEHSLHFWVEQRFSAAPKPFLSTASAAEAHKSAAADPPLPNFHLHFQYGTFDRENGTCPSTIYLPYLQPHS